MKFQTMELMVLPICEGGDICADDLVAAIKYANDMGADICNILAVVVDSENAIREAIHNSDMYFVVAAGNFQDQYITGLDLRENKRFPACCIDNRVITVGSTNEKNEFSVFSNYSPMYVDIAAPGEYIYSTLPRNNYGYRDGTSVASPIVAGILGAYYYCYTDTIEEAAEKLLVDSKIIKELSEKVHEGRLVEFK